MAFHDISSPKTFSAELKKIEVSDPVHFELNNKLFGQLINNDAYLKEYVDEQIKKVIGGSVEALDTLRELADALGNDANFSTTVINLINSRFDSLAGAGRTTETVKGLSDLMNTLKNNFDKLTLNVKEIKVVDKAPTASEAVEGVLYLVKEGAK